MNEFDLRKFLYKNPLLEDQEEKDEASKKALDKKEDELDEKDMETETLKEKIKHHADAIKNIKKELEDLNKDLGEDEEDKEKEEKEVKEAVDMAEEALKKHREEQQLDEVPADRYGSIKTDDDKSEKKTEEEIDGMKARKPHKGKEDMGQFV